MLKLSSQVSLFWTGLYPFDQGSASQCGVFFGIPVEYKEHSKRLRDHFEGSRFGLDLAERQP